MSYIPIVHYILHLFTETFYFVHDPDGTHMSGLLINLFSILLQSVITQYTMGIYDIMHYMTQYTNWGRYL